MGEHMSDGPGPAAEFAALARELREGHSKEEVYQAVCDRAIRLVDGCDRAAVGVLDGQYFTSAAATDDVMRLIDRLQNQLGEGPCLDASTDQSIHVDNDITVASKWPNLARLVVEHTPVRAMLAVPLVHAGRRTGAVNLFADRPHAFTDESVGQAAILAAFASVALMSAAQTARAEQLAVGLQTNREIGAAVGILMATHGISQDEAFTLLSQASQRLNRKLRDIARSILAGETTPERSPGETR
jgi:GAF domain-containing protein